MADEKSSVRAARRRSAPRPARAAAAPAPREGAERRAALVSTRAEIAQNRSRASRRATRRAPRAALRAPALCRRGVRHARRAGVRGSRAARCDATVFPPLASPPFAPQPPLSRLLRAPPPPPSVARPTPMRASLAGGGLAGWRQCATHLSCRNPISGRPTPYRDSRTSPPPAACGGHRVGIRCERRSRRSRRRLVRRCIGCARTRRRRARRPPRRGADRVPPKSRRDAV